MTIPVTQYLRPNRRKRQLHIECSPEVTEMALTAINRDNAHFTAEELLNGMISLTCEHENNDIAIRLSHNDESVLKAFEEVVRNAFKILEELNAEEE